MQPDRFNSRRYRSWVKTSLSLCYLKEGVTGFSNDTAAAFHKDIFQRISLRNPQVAIKKCGSCTHRQAVKTKSKDKKTTTWRMNCRLNICSVWLEEILPFHRHQPCPDIAWNNSAPTLWPSDCWELVKLFQPFGCQQQRRAEDCDATGLLSMIQDCSYFSKFITNPAVIQDIKNARHACMHSNDLEMSDADMTTSLNLMVAFLEEPQLKKYQSACDAALKIKQLRDNILDLALNRELELKALCNKMTEMEQNITGVKDDTQNLRDNIRNMIDNLSHDISAVRLTTQKHQTTISTLYQRQQTTNGTLMTHGSLLQQHQGKIITHEARLGKLELHIEAQHRQLESLGRQQVTLQTDQPVDIKGLQRQLISLYEAKRQHIPVYLLRSERKIRLEDIYVEQCLKVVDPDGRLKTDSTISHRRHQACSEDCLWIDSHGRCKSDKNEKFISSLRDVFYREGNKCQFVYVSGNAGYGKSVFCSHLVRLWCKAHSDIITALTQDEALMAEFPLLFCVDLRDVTYIEPDQMSDELCSLIQKQLQLSKLGLTYNDLSKLLQAEGQVLVVMDALDMCKEERLPRGGLYNGYTTLVTSRPWKLEALRCDPECRVDKELEIVGLKKGSLEDLSENLMKLLNRKCNKCKNSKDFLMQMYEQGLEELLCVPNFLLSVLPLWFEDVPVGMSLTEIYKNIFHHQLLAAVYMKDIPEYSCSNEASFPICQRDKCPCKCYGKLLWKVSEFACKALLSNVWERSLVMDHDQTAFLGLTDKEVAICLKLGILTQYKLVGCVTDYEPQNSVSFSHKTYQEWFAALYISSKLPVSELGKLLSEAIIDLDSALELDQLFLFVCGMNEDVAAKLSEFIMSKVSTDTRIQEYRRSNNDGHDQLIRTIQDVVVAGREEALKNNKETGALQLHDVYIEGDSKKFSSEKILACDTSQAKSVYLRNIHKEEGDFKESKITPWPPSSFLEKLHLQNITNSLDNTFCDNFSAAHLVHLLFGNFTLTHDQLESLCASLASAGSLRTVDIGEITCIKHKDNKQDCSFMFDLSQHQGLEHLTLQNLGVAEVKGISLSQNMGKLEMIKLRNVTLTHDQLESLCVSLATAGSLRTVDIEGITCITHKDNKQDCSFMFDLSQHQGLEHVTLQDLGVAEVKGVSLSQNMDKLEKVELRGFLISSAAVRQILKNLPEHQMEVKLGVHDSPLRLRGKEEVRQLLKEIRHPAPSHKQHGWIFELRMESNQEEITVFPLEREPGHIKDAGSGQEDHEHEPVTEQEPGAEPVQEPESEREMKAEPEREPKKDLESEPGKEAKQTSEIEVEPETEQEPQLEQEMETEPAQVNEAEQEPKRVPNPAAEHGKEPENTAVREEDDKPEEEPKAETKVKEEEAGDKSAENKVEQVPIQEQIYQTVNCCVDSKLATVKSQIQESQTQIQELKQELNTRIDKLETSKEDGANSVTSSKAVQANEQHTRSNRQKRGCWKCGSHDHLYKNCPAKKGKGKRDAPVKKKQPVQQGPRHTQLGEDVPMSFPELESTHFDGRLVELDAGKMEKLTKKILKEGKFGETFTYLPIPTISSEQGQQNIGNQMDTHQQIENSWAQIENPQTLGFEMQGDRSLDCSQQNAGDEDTTMTEGASVQIRSRSIQGSMDTDYAGTHTAHQNLERRSSAPPATSSYTTKEISTALESPHFDGRLVKVDTEQMMNLMTSGTFLGEGAFGKAYQCDVEIESESESESKSEKRKMVIKMVIKKISYEKDSDNLCSAIREKMASRIKHPFIVPIVAFAEDTENKIFYFMMSYMPNGDLQNAIQNKASDLKVPVRLRILLQLAAVLKYLHTPVHDFRGAYVHGDISSPNIVLDQMFNIRLLDFGLSKEVKGHRTGTTYKSSTRAGTKGYTPKDGEFTPERDCWSWAAIALEIITGQKAAGFNDKCLMEMEEKNVMSRYGVAIKTIWGNHIEKAKSILELVNLCKVRFAGKLTSVDPDSAETAKEIVKKMKDIARNTGVEFYEKLRENDKCLICMVNNKIEGNIMGHVHDMELCVACLRNSYLNPIQCPMCLKKLSSQIGTHCAAVLIAGNDVDNKRTAKAFKEDVDKFYKTVTCKRHLTMGLRETNVHRVYLDEEELGRKNKRITLIPRLDTAFANLLSQSRSESVNTLLLYFSGHTNEDKKFILGREDETLSEKELSDRMGELLSTGIKKLLVFLDCCYPKHSRDYRLTDDILDAKLTILKITACRPNERAESDQDEGSLFTNLLLQCLSGKSTHCLRSETCRVCTDINLTNKCSDGFISIEYISEYIGKHMPFTQQPTKSMRQADWQATKLAYYRPDVPDVMFQLYYNVGNSVPVPIAELPENVHILKKQLLGIVEGIRGLDPVRSKHFLDVYAIVVPTPKMKYQLEKCTIAQIESAWNGLSELHVVPRHINNIDNGKVGFFIDGEQPKPELILDIVSKHMPKDEAGKVVVVKIPATELEDMLFSSWSSQLEDTEQSDRIKANLLALVDNYDQQRLTEKTVVFTFEYDDSSEGKLEKFFSVHLEPIENQHDDRRSSPSNVQ